MSTGNQHLKHVFGTVFLATMIGSQTYAAGIYRYTDENGVTVFSQQAPDKSIKSQKLKAAPPPAVNPTIANEQLAEEIQRLEDLREDRAISANSNSEARQKKDDRKVNCQAGKKNLANYSAYGRKRVRDKNGEFKRITEQERQRRINKAKKRIAENC